MGTDSILSWVEVLGAVLGSLTALITAIIALNQSPRIGARI
jgi:hypothetical protein